MTRDFRAEGKIFGRYLLGRAPSERALLLYVRAAELRAASAWDARDTAALRLAQRSPWTLPCIDAALALVRPPSQLRAHVLLMSAILEAQPEYCNEFLPQDSSFGHGLRIAAMLAAAAVRAALGMLLLAMAR